MKEPVVRIGRHSRNRTSEKHDFSHGVSLPKIKEALLKLSEASCGNLVAPPGIMMLIGHSQNEWLV